MRRPRPTWRRRRPSAEPVLTNLDAPVAAPPPEPPKLEQVGAAPEPAKPEREARPHESEDDEKEIEATKAPLMEHLIELRSRLIKALIAFALTFVVCFFFAKRHLQHPGLAVRLGRRA